MNTYEISLTRTSYEVTTVRAANPEDARRACEAFHSPDSVEIHSINEVDLPPASEVPENQDQMLDEHSCTGCIFDTDDFDTFELGCAHPRLTDPTLQEDCFTPKPKPIKTDCPNCLYNVEEARDLSGCMHPDNDGDWRSEFWSQGTEACFMPKMPIITPGDTVFETTEFCASCGGVMLMSGDKEWCSVCAKLIPMKSAGV